MSSTSSRSSGYDTTQIYDTGSEDRRRRPRHSNRVPQGFNLPRRRTYDPWLAEAKRTLLHRQADFFNRVDGRGPVNNTENIDEELKQALLDTRANVTSAEKRAIRRWAIDHHIDEVLQIAQNPTEARDMLDRHRTALVSVRDDDGGDHMYLVQGMAQFSLAIDKWDLEIINLEQGDSEQNEPAVHVGGRRWLQATRQSSLDAASGTDNRDHRVPTWSPESTGRAQRVPR